MLKERVQALLAVIGPADPQHRRSGFAGCDGVEQRQGRREGERERHLAAWLDWKCKEKGRNRGDSSADAQHWIQDAPIAEIAGSCVPGIGDHPDASPRRQVDHNLIQRDPAE